ncbi:MAG: HNH endonuclease [Candidatus Riesia sp.]|nr:HNH endonuclease [Candidatus Riesia sp.]
MSRKKWNGSNWIRKEKRLAIYLRDETSCVYCMSRVRLTLDHIVPRKRGGSNRSTNLVTSCLSCNSKRKDQPIAMFADKEAFKRIKQRRRRKLKPYLVRAKFILGKA